MTRYFLRLSYKGTTYHGWQVQDNANTVQAELNRALATYLRSPVETVGAGRTDTGVHAKNYVAHFDCEDGSLEENRQTFLHKLNCILPDDIALLGVKKMHDTAHARFDATSRTYQYILAQQKSPFFLEHAYFYFPPLHVEAMNEAAQLLTTYSDFTSFCKLHSDTKTNNCKLSHARWVHSDDGMLVFTITSDRFLRDMVRSIVGTLLEVGKGRMPISRFKEVVEAKSRQAAGMSAPAQGLYFTGISYPYDIE